MANIKKIAGYSAGGVAVLGAAAFFSVAASFGARDSEAKPNITAPSFNKTGLDNDETGQSGTVLNQALNAAIRDGETNLHYWRADSAIDTSSAEVAFRERDLASGYYLVFQADGPAMLMAIDERDEGGVETERDNRVVLLEIPEGHLAVENIEKAVDRDYYDRGSIAQGYLNLYRGINADIFSDRDVIVPLARSICGSPNLLSTNGQASGYVDVLGLSWEADLSQNPEVIEMTIPTDQHKREIGIWRSGSVTINADVANTILPPTAG